MPYTLIRECSVVLLYKGKGYHFDALSNFEFTQTYNRTSDTRRTLHSKNAKPNTIISSKNAATANLTLLCTDAFQEGVFFDLLGMESLGNARYKYQSINNVTPNTCDIYVISNYDVYKISKACVTSLDFPLSFTTTGQITVSFTASNIEKSKPLDNSAGIVKQGQPWKPGPIQFKYGHLLYNSVVSAGISFRQDVQWRNDRSLHDVGKIYVPSHPVITNTGITASITTHLRDDIRTTDIPENIDVELSQSNLYILFKNAFVSKRLQTEDVFIEAYDLALTEQSDVILELGGTTI